MASSYSDLIRKTSIAPSSPLTQPISISPATGGVALDTSFSVDALRFSGELEPLRYTFKIIGSDGTETIIGGGALLSSTSTSAYLPAGTLTIAVDVTNGAGETSRVTTSIVVNDPVSSSTPSSINEFANNVSSTLLQDALDAGDNSGAVEIVKLLSDLLNSDSTDDDDSASKEERVTIRHNLLQTLNSSVSDGDVDPSSVADTLDSLTSHDLTNATAGVGLGLASSLITQLLNGGSNGGRATGSLTGVLSNVLGATSSCDAVNEIGRNARSLTGIGLTGSIAGEDPISYAGDNLGVAGQRTFPGGTGLLGLPLRLGGTSIELGQEATDTDEDYADLHVVQYSSSSSDGSSSLASQCFGLNVSSSNDTLDVDVVLSPITDITLVNDNGTEIEVANLTEPILFNLPLSQAFSVITDYATRLCPRRATCSYYDPVNQIWSSEGCSLVTVSVSDDDGVSGVAKCQCNHMTEFAVLARDATSCSQTTAAERAVYGIFAIFYTLTAIAGGLQISRIVWYTKSKFKFDLMAAEHVCVIIIALFRAVTGFMRSGREI